MELFTSILNKLMIFNIAVVSILLGGMAILGFLILGPVIFSGDSRKIKGRLGEWALSKILNKRCGKGTAMLDDVTLKLSEHDTTQIDHVFIAPSGIFVIETKLYKGRIFGGQYDSKWVQKFYRSSYTFQNPFRQNYKHVKSIQALFPDIPAVHIHSVVVMAGECTWGDNDKPDMLFMSGWALADFIEGHMQTQADCIDVKDVKLRINEARLKRGSETDKKHIQNIKNIRRSKSEV